MAEYKESLLNGYQNVISYECTKKIIEQMERDICKINIGMNQGTGFFTKIPFPNENKMLPVLITNNHVINNDILNKDNMNIELDIKKEEKAKEIILKIDPNTTIYNPGEYPLKKAIVHIPGEMPLTVPLAYVPNIPINEKIMKAIPTKMQPQFKKIAQIQEDISKKENINFEEGDNDKNNNINNKNKSHSKNILENLKKMKYCYNDPNPDNNEHLITDLLKNEDDEDETENKK